MGIDLTLVGDCLPPELRVINLDNGQRKFYLANSKLSDNKDQVQYPLIITFNSSAQQCQNASSEISYIVMTKVMPQSMIRFGLSMQEMGFDIFASQEQCQETLAKFNINIVPMPRAQLTGSSHLSRFFSFNISYEHEKKLALILQSVNKPLDTKSEAAQSSCRLYLYGSLGARKHLLEREFLAKGFDQIEDSLLCQAIIKNNTAEFKKLFKQLNNLLNKRSISKEVLENLKQLYCNLWSLAFKFSRHDVMRVLAEDFYPVADNESVLSIEELCNEKIVVFALDSNNNLEEVIKTFETLQVDLKKKLQHYGQSMFHVAISSGTSPDIIEQLKDYLPIDYFWKDKDGNSFLHHAYRHLNSKWVCWLVKHQQLSAVNFENKKPEQCILDGKTVEEFASFIVDLADNNQGVKAADFFINVYCNLTLLCVSKVLSSFIDKGQPQLLSLFFYQIFRGLSSQPEITDKAQTLYLWFHALWSAAAQKENTEMLVAVGNLPRAKDNICLKQLNGDNNIYYPVVHWVCESNHNIREKIAYLKEFNPNVINDSLPLLGETPLMLSIIFNFSSEIYRTLITNGASVNLTDAQGNNSLHIASAYQNIAAIKEIMAQQGAKDLLEKKNRCGRLPFQEDPNRFHSSLASISDRPQPPKWEVHNFANMLFDGQEYGLAVELFVSNPPSIPDDTQCHSISKFCNWTSKQKMINYLMTYGSGNEKLVKIITASHPELKPYVERKNDAMKETSV